MLLSGNYVVILDACVLAPPSLCDLLLRLAETPRLYLPRWTEDILDEVHRTQVNKFHFEERLANYWRAEVTKAFPEAMVTDYEPHIPQCTNDPKDRHVLAAAIRCSGCDIITSNLKDFPNSTLAPWGITATSPASFLLSLYDMKPAIVLSKIDDMARDRHRTREEILKTLSKTVALFAGRVAGDLEIDLA